MFGWCFSSRHRDEHWWDADELVRARNVEFEDRLDELVEDYGVEHPRRRKSDDDMNQWLKLALYAGVPAAIAVYMVIQQSTRFDAKLDHNTRMLEQHAQVTATISDRLAASDRAQYTIVNLLRAQCVNAAKNQQERTDCLRAGQ
jgi:hypothetical protein